MARLTPQPWNGDGSGVTTQAAASGGDQIPNSRLPGRVPMLYVDNSASGGPVDIRAVGDGQDSFQLAARDATFTVGAGAQPFLLGAFRPGRFGPLVTLTYPQGVDALQVAAVLIGELDGIADGLPSAPALGSSPGEIPVVRADASGSFSELSAAAGADGDYLPNATGDIELVVDNANGVEWNVWFRARASNHGVAIHKKHAAPPGQQSVSLLLPTDRFGSRVAVVYEDPANPGVLDATGLRVLGVRNVPYET